MNLIHFLLYKIYKIDRNSEIRKKYPFIRNLTKFTITFKTK